MKHHNIKIATGLLAAGMALAGCSGILDETPRETYTPEFSTKQRGIEGGITALYANLRNLWGNGYWLIANETGTDEYTFGHGGNENDKPIDMSNNGELNATNCRADNLWNTAFSDINTANSVLENGTAIGMSESLLSEARFFRAFDYFWLVQTFGGVPLDLGAGELKFNATATRLSKRNTVPEVYTKAIFPDLLTAVSNLPEVGRVTGGLTKTAARLVLAKAYLTYGWWLENPNNIPTYPEAARTDPDGHDANWYYRQAYEMATTAIANPGKFALQKSFYLVNVGTNDRNSEIVLYADHTESSNYYDGRTNFDWGNGNAPGNFARWMCRWDYTFLESSKSSAQWTKFRSVAREAVQGKDRPWKQMATPQEVTKITFKEKHYDSRYDGTFAYQFRGNWDRSGNASGMAYNANMLPVNPGDSILTFLDEDDTSIQWPAASDNGGAGQSNVGAGWLPGRADWVVGPSQISRYKYLNLWKNGIYRTDNGTGLGRPNGDSPRPYPVLKFSELYLIAAEAAVKLGMNSEARNLVNVIRARAGVWTYDNNRQREKSADYSAEMTAATPATITIDYILDERSREFFGECYRWTDLVRTQTWADRAKIYTICGLHAADRTPQTVTRTITPQKYLRPIPQGQLDALDMTAAEKAAYQNPSYTN